MSFDFSNNIYLKHLFSFNGRINRKLFICYFLTWFLILQGIAMFCNISADPYSLRIYWVLSVLFFISSLALQIKRTHDLGWNTYMPIIFYIAIHFIIISIYPDPKIIFSPYTPDHNSAKLMITSYSALASLIYLTWLIILLALPGNKGPNKYGSDPLGRPAPTDPQNQEEQDKE